MHTITVTCLDGRWYADVYEGRRLLHTFVKRSAESLENLLDERFPWWRK